MVVAMAPLNSNMSARWPFSPHVTRRTYGREKQQREEKERRGETTVRGSRERRDNTCRQGDPSPIFGFLPNFIFE
jgi:hypothetical protein